MAISRVSVLLAALLLFLVQPLLAKAILPWFGGTAAVWSTCLLFFQSLLLLGYAYAHASVAWLPPRAQSILHLSLLAGSLFLLPIHPNASWLPEPGDSDPTPRILGLLLVSVGGPYLLLSATTPLVQSWAARSGPSQSLWPLYSLSNAGSLLALLAYPTLIEPWTGTSDQMLGWSLAYAGFAAVVAGCALPGLRHPRGVASSAAASPHSPPPSGTVRTLWITLPACASALLLAVTNQLCQDVAPIPFLWVLPLALYLISFILCFAGDRVYRRVPFQVAAVLLLATMAFALKEGNALDFRLGVALFSAGLFCSCMVLHGEWSRLKPDQGRLTAFYLSGSLGGALGGAFVALIAPRWYTHFFELHAAMVGTALLGPLAAWHDPAGKSEPVGRRARILVPLQISALILAGLLWWVAKEQAGLARVRVRNFYGILVIRDRYDTPSGRPIRLLMHGVTRHGQQFLDPEKRRAPTSYFGPRSGVGLVLRFLRPDQPRRIGIVGLGAGTLAAYGKPGDVLRFYEINPDVIRLARTHFTFLSDCPGEVDILPGDARLTLEGEPPQEYDLLAIDAFSSDAIPLHLLTREAFRLYLRHLRPDGVLALHISNNHLDLRPVVLAIAEDLGKPTWVVPSFSDPLEGILGATWILLTDRTDLFQIPQVDAAGAPREGARPGIPAWTDDHSNLFRILK